MSVVTAIIGLLVGIGTSILVLFKVVMPKWEADQKERNVEAEARVKQTIDDLRKTYGDIEQSKLKTVEAEDSKLRQVDVVDIANDVIRG